MVSFHYDFVVVGCDLQFVEGRGGARADMYVCYDLQSSDDDGRTLMMVGSQPQQLLLVILQQAAIVSI